MNRGVGVAMWLVERGYGRQVVLRRGGEKHFTDPMYMTRGDGRVPPLSPISFLPSFCFLAQ
jgi:hypothetical protein